MNSKFRVLLATAAMAPFCIWASGAAAQTGQAPSADTRNQSPPSAEEGAQQAEATATGDEIVVTGSRVGLRGFQAPTPTRVLTSEQLEARGLANVGEFLNEVPSLRPTSSPSTNTQTALGGGQFYADLRALGSIRTLTLVDGRRFVPSTASGQVDLNLIPTLLVTRVDVVTGGASAAYGSDAISGVVNVLLDKKLSGFKADISSGISEEGDAGERRASAAFGTAFAGGKGHFVVGGEYVDSDGVDSYFSRDWGREQPELVSYVGARPAGTPSRFYARGVQALNYAYGGVILGVNADTNAANGRDVLRGIQFGPGGTVQPFPYGDAVGTSATNFTGGDPGLYARTGHQLVLPIKRRVAMGHLDYEFSDALTAFAEFNWGRSAATFHASPVRDTTATSLVIRRDNAFLPSSIATIMDANGITSFGLGREYSDFGQVRAKNENTTTRGAVGLNGNLGGGWSWDAYYQYGKNIFDSTLNGLRLEQNFRFAADSVLLNGQAVCRDATARANGCVALNPFGQGSPSAASIAYVTGLATYRVKTEQQVAAANLRGSPFATWAGDVAIALGAEYRKESADAVADPISNAGGFNYSNPRSFSGSYDVKEGFVEIVAPLARDLPLLQKLDVNAAVRLTDYSSTGRVTTWKVGGTWAPVDGLLVRATRSRDIRAPNNSELFSTLTSRSSLVNSFTGATDQLVVIASPSPDLKPETSDTFTVGAVLSPSFLPGLNISVDYYDIKVEGAISSIPAQTIIDRCAAEVGERHARLLLFLRRPDGDRRPDRHKRGADAVAQHRPAQVERSRFRCELPLRGSARPS